MPQPVPEPKPAPIFISYSSRDVTLAEALHARLSDAGFDVWFDRYRLKPGFNWHEKIEQGCEAARIVLPILTPNWRKSVWTRYETYGAEQVIPLVYQGVIPKIIPPPYRAKHALDMRTSQPGELESLLREYLARPAPEKEPRTAHLPQFRTEHFVGREQLLLDLHEKLHPAPTPNLMQRPAYIVAGMGGVGKTTAAREYADRYWRAYQDILWVNASETGSMPLEFARLAREVGLVDEASQDAGKDAERALKELSGQVCRLLVLDNAPDQDSVFDWIPKVGQCRTVVTSRFTGWPPAQTVNVTVLEPGPARELLLLRSGRSKTPENRAGADELAKMLDYLPLALEQAAAYIDQTGMSFASYMEEYRKSHAELLAENLLSKKQYPDSVATTWQTSIARVGPLAKLVLTLCSFLAPDSIPRKLISAAIPTLEEAGAPAPITSAALLKALRELSNYSLIRLAESDGPITVHRLVQTVQRDSLASDESRRQWSERVVNLLSKEFPFDDFATWKYCESLLPHASMVFGWKDEQRIETAEAANLYSSAGAYLWGRGQYAAAEPLGKLSLTISEKTFGDSHTKTATALNILATFYLSQGKYSEAELLNLRALAIRERVLGPEHPDTAKTLNNLANVLGEQGRYPEAEPLYLRALAIREQSLGPEHPLTATTLNNLANIYRFQGRYLEAEPLLKRTLAIQEKQQGADHPDTARTLNNLAIVFRGQGRYPEAEPLIRRSLAIREKALGPEHPETAESVNNLAGLYRDRGEFSEAEPLYQRALSIWKNSLGIDHPYTISALNNLAGFYSDQEKYTDAEPLLLQVLATSGKAFGADRLETADSLNGLADLYLKQGRLEEAEPLCMRALAIWEKELGPGHINTAIALNNLAEVYRDQGKYSESEPLFLRALAITEKALGKDHPNYKEIQEHYEKLLELMGRVGQKPESPPA